MHDRSMQPRALSTLTFLALATWAVAQEPAAPAAAPAAPDHTLLYVLAALAAGQAIIIVSLSGILRTLGGMHGLGRNAAGQGGRAALVAALLLAAGSASAQEHVPPANGITDQASFWWLAVLNALLFAIILMQLGWTRRLTRMAAGEQAAAPAPVAEKARTSRWQVLLSKLNRQVKIEEEKNIELDHDYDGIKELDNVLPPWWLWLFYGTIAWGVVYLVNVHVIKVWPDSQAEYTSEMAQAKASIAAYQATQTNAVDENNVTFTDDPAVLAEGKTIFDNNCVACHGAGASGSEFSVGPNLTDAYWLHGGGIKNVFHTIKYGVPEKGMISWKAQLQPAEIRAVACYILSQAGKGGPGQKAPQGELWKDEAAPASADSAKVAAAN